MNHIILVSFFGLSGLSAAYQTHHPNYPRKEPTDSTRTSLSPTTVPGTTTLASTPNSAASPNPTGPFSSSCASELEKVKGAMPSRPAGLIRFSSSYYKTHPRTADDPSRECAWIADIPDDFNDVTFDFWNKTDEWRFERFDRVTERDKRKDITNYISCVNNNTATFPCEEAFWFYVLDTVMEVLEAPPDDSPGDESGAGEHSLSWAVGLPMAVIIVTFTGGLLGL
ncbi:uncharacterized protein DNG_05156 [Cephalotrichum gorgonifer]|uniref:Uncharacterized protein n=1 Tax=Cephalotrichum gorgonifer TaxID=2041049 RepID=A0AAE8MZX4_9PEZI|nr:uncharacterized protein DNG_05156 [Cephalotrichum gorgonifer]